MATPLIRYTITPFYKVTPSKGHLSNQSRIQIVKYFYIVPLKEEILLIRPPFQKGWP
jgi:hypothetical protein